MKKKTKSPTQLKLIKNEETKKWAEEMEDYYAKNRPSPSDVEQAEGDEGIVDEALRNLEKRVASKKAA
jgi:hypothetical protein